MIVVIGIMIALVNYIFTFILKYIIELVGVDSVTKQNNILKTVFTCLSVFNKCIIILLINANFEFTDFMFNGEYSDYTTDWFKTNGKIIIHTMTTTIFIPVINFFVCYMGAYY